MAAETRKLTRDCDAILIPSAEHTRLLAGGQLRIMQKRGGNFTVLTEAGQMARIVGADADALGEEVASNQLAATFQAESVSEKDILQQLQTVYDPEIPVSIVELGLVYGSELEALPSGGSRVHLRMTLTAPGCAMSDVIKRDVENKLRALPGVEDVQVELVFDPPWSRDRMSDVARLELGML